MKKFNMEQKLFMLILIIVLSGCFALFERVESTLCIFETNKCFKFRAYHVAAGATTVEYVGIEKVYQNGEKEAIGFYMNDNDAKFLKLNDSTCLLLVNFVGENLNNKPDSILLNY